MAKEEESRLVPFSEWEERNPKEGGVIREWLTELGRRHPKLKKTFYDFLQYPGEDAYNPWPEDDNVRR